MADPSTRRRWQFSLRALFLAASFLSAGAAAVAGHTLGATIVLIFSLAIAEGPLDRV